MTGDLQDCALVTSEDITVLNIRRPAAGRHTRLVTLRDAAWRSEQVTSPRGTLMLPEQILSSLALVESEAKVDPTLTERRKSEILSICEEEKESKNLR